MAADQWLTAKSLDREADVAAPSWWRQWSADEIAVLVRTGTRTGGGNSKSVTAHKTFVDGVRVDVVLKRRKNPNSTGVVDLHLEALYLDYLRGEPGIPLLHGAFFDRQGALTLVVQHAGKRMLAYLNAYSSTWYAHSFYKQVAVKDPLGIARAWIRLFRSFAERGGFLLGDFTARQFTYGVDADGAPIIFLVDGPYPHTGPLAEALRMHPTNKIRANMRRHVPGKCNVSADCTGLKIYHCCCSQPFNAPHQSRGLIFTLKDIRRLCGADTGAPESHGVCGGYGAAPGLCAPFIASGHLYDLGGKSWILPWLIKLLAENGLPKKSLIIKDIVQRCTRPEPRDRPTFDELLALLAGVD